MSAAFSASTCPHRVSLYSSRALLLQRKADYHSSAWHPLIVHHACREKSVLACRALYADVFFLLPLTSVHTCPPTRSSIPLSDGICSYCSLCQNVLPLDSHLAPSLPFLLDSAQGDHLWLLFTLEGLYLLHLPCFLLLYSISDHVIYSMFAVSLSIICFPWYNISSTKAALVSVLLPVESHHPEGYLAHSSCSVVIIFLTLNFSALQCGFYFPVWVWIWHSMSWALPKVRLRVRACQRESTRKKFQRAYCWGSQMWSTAKSALARGGKRQTRAKFKSFYRKLVISVWDWVLTFWVVAHSFLCKKMVAFDGTFLLCCLFVCLLFPLHCPHSARLESWQSSVNYFAHYILPDVSMHLHI